MSLTSGIGMSVKSSVHVKRSRYRFARAMLGMGVERAKTASQCAYNSFAMAAALEATSRGCPSTTMPAMYFFLDDELHGCARLRRDVCCPATRRCLPAEASPARWASRAP